MSGRGAEHDFDGQDASLEEDGLDGFGRDPAEQGAGGRNGSGGQGCVKLYWVFSMSYSALEMFIGALYATAG